MPAHARTLRQLLYALIGMPLGLAGLAYTAYVVAGGALLSLTVVGLPVLSAGLRGARLLGGLHRALARRLLGVATTAPPPPRGGAGLTGWVRAGLTDRAAWRAVVYLILKAPIAVLSMAVVIVGYGYGFGALTYPAWWRLIPSQADAVGVLRAGLPLPGGVYLDTWPRAILTAGIGAVLLLLAPLALRAVLTLDRMLVTDLLDARRLDERVRELEASRNFAVQESAAALRRIERDLHDGAQARLVALAMNLGAAKEHLEQSGGDPQTRELVGTAHRDAKAALVELRDLVRGIHPPILDSGLDAALATLAARSPVAVDLTVTIARRPSPAVETIAYFCIAELLTNVAKHSGAPRAVVGVEQNDGRLRLRVADQGRGGAQARGGLAGLTDRVRTVDGRLDIDSPVGGPTVVTVELPCPS
ncbi:histidine kinase [Actinoplanes cyaneus]|uniref:histidine kinase n=1 Tax=Actinoplanes cyaneus TaxID=52696 RepID=A0A919M1B6_9ACTN|nr:sensor histidine kinase [Actinoplanes cyaneus]MCW2142665.1 Signal transduction histidine kinase [Actinoplanes cyaneus]GID62212.1 histidine kinase [Actinoplanes cyaneus]